MLDFLFEAARYQLRRCRFRNSMTLHRALTKSHNDNLSIARESRTADLGAVVSALKGLDAAIRDPIPHLDIAVSRPAYVQSRVVRIVHLKQGEQIRCKS